MGEWREWRGPLDEEVVDAGRTCELERLGRVEGTGEPSEDTSEDAEWEFVDGEVGIDSRLSADV